MTILPVIVRELRAEARRPWNYWLRLLAGAAVTSVFAFAMVARGLSVTSNGAMLFGMVNWLLSYGIWLCVPLLTADCLSREKREGTLGLLFLTPLKAYEIVLAKSVVHLLRAVSFVFAALPVVTIPLLIGGVSGRHVVELLASLLGIILLALAAGLLASAFAREWIRAVLLAGIFVFMMFVLLRLQARLIVPVLLALGGPPPPGGVTMAAVPFLWLWSIWEEWSVPLVVFILTVFIAQARLRSAGLDESLSKRKLWWLKTFCQPIIWRKRFRTSMSRTLDANPLGWLQQYSWSARLTKWGWCFIVIAVETYLLTTNSWVMFRSQQHLLLILLGLGMAFSSVGSFRRERQTGALELILVSPLRAQEIVLGRLKGIWFQFAPAFLIFVATVWFGSEYTAIFGGAMDSRPILPLILTMFFTLPLIGLYQSLRRSSFLVGWLMTCAIAVGSAVTGWILVSILLIPGVLLTSGARFSAGEVPGDFLLLAALLAEIAVACFLGGELVRDLDQRNFALEKQVS